MPEHRTTAMRYSERMAPVPAITVHQTVAFRKTATSFGLARWVDWPGGDRSRWRLSHREPAGHHYLVIADRIYLLDCYAKNEKSDLTPAQTKRLAELIKQLKEKYRAS